jgi:hypothetical protein
MICCVTFKLATKHRQRNIMKPITGLNSALDRGVIKQIFDHVRNYMICAFILAVGTTELRQQESQFFDLIPPGYAGSGVIFVASVLIFFNLYDGIRRISRSKYHFSLNIGLVLLYLFLSVRVVEMAWHFRDMPNGIVL